MQSPTLPQQPLPAAPAAEVATYWERVARSAWGKYISSVERDALLGAHELAGQPGHAFEIGAEGGRWSKLLADLGWNVTCTDVDRRSLRVCQAKVPSANIIHVRPSETRIPSDSASTDLLLCIEVAPVIKSPWFPEEASRVLKDNGLLVGVFFNKLSYRGLIGHFKAALARRYDYYDTAYIAWKRKVERIGFSFLQERGICWFPFARVSDSPLIPICCSVERRLRLQRLPAISPWVVFLARKDKVTSGRPS